MQKKKRFGQHFLNNPSIAIAIADALEIEKLELKKVVEIGPGEGALTQHLVKLKDIELKAIELDRRLPERLIKKYPVLEENLISADFLKVDLNTLFQGSFNVIGNFPYNISSQIVFKVLENKELVPMVIGMFQKEMAQRIGAKPRTKAYGVISVLTQVYYDIEWLFDVGPEQFTPPPRVMSAVIKMKRHNRYDEIMDYQALRRIVKMGFSQRRKKLRNTLKPLDLDWESFETDWQHCRAEELTLENFIDLSNKAISS